MTNVLIRENRGEGPVKSAAETGVMLPQAEKGLEVGDAKRNLP